MEPRNLPDYGQPVLIRELYSAEGKIDAVWSGRSVSITGRLHAHDVSNCRAKIVDPRLLKHIVIDTTLVEPFPAKIGSLFQFIGEIVDGSGEEQFVVQARVVRHVDGLDMVLYEQALQAQQEYLKSRQIIY